MKRVIFCLAIAIGWIGCASMLPKIQDTNRQGYERLVKIKPECANPSLEVYADCLKCSEMLEAQSPERATTIFLTHWESSVFGYIKKKKDAGDVKPGLTGLSDTMAYSPVLSQNIQSFKNISIPILNEIYLSSSTKYADKMTKHLQLIDIDSQSSFDSFREAHVKAATE